MVRDDVPDKPGVHSYNGLSPFKIKISYIIQGRATRGDTTKATVSKVEMSKMKFVV